MEPLRWKLEEEWGSSGDFGTAFAAQRQQIRHRNIQHSCDRHQYFDRWIADAGSEIGKIAFG